MEASNMTEEKNTKNRNLIIAVVAVVILCCCCAVASFGGYFYTTRNSSSELQSVPQAQDDDLPPIQISTDPPAGGLGNDILKEDTWNLISSAAIAYGCDVPLGAKSSIEILQEPDAGGIWYEKWTIGCLNDEEYPFEVEFILDDTGATFNIRLLDE